MAVRKERVLYFEGPGRVSVRDVDLSGPVADGQVEVTSALIGISHGTEMKVFAGDLPAAEAADLTLEALRCPMSYPLRYGYINVGTTAGGERVFAFYPHQTRFRVAARDTAAIPADVPFDDAVFLASMETALAVCQDAAPVAGESVLVVGQGVIGLLVAEILGSWPLARVVTLEPHAARRRASEALGCLALDPADSDVAARLAGATAGRGFDTAVNVSGDGAGRAAGRDRRARLWRHGGRGVVLRKPVREPAPGRSVPSPATRHPGEPGLDDHPCPLDALGQGTAPVGSHGARAAACGPAGTSPIAFPSRRRSRPTS